MKLGTLRAGICTALLLTGAPVCAQDEGSPAWLPPPGQVEAALRAQPVVRAAAAQVDAAIARQQALRVGTHEFEAGAVTQRRRVDGSARDYNEWELQLSRAIRLPGKARLDREIGGATREVATLQLTDSEHQSARRLLDVWMEWLRSEVVAAETAAQDALLAREQAAMTRRVALGDAARREADVMDAERALLATQRIAAEDAARVARQMLSMEFPHITVPTKAPALPDPEPLEGGAQAWMARIIGESAEIGIADGQATLLERIAERARANRRPDPTVGVRVLSDLGGAERSVGLVLSVPLSGAYRKALAGAESASAVAAQADADAVRRAVEQTAWTAVQAAGSRYVQWQSCRQALDAQQAASSRTRRAWELGEAPLSEHLLSQRTLRQVRLSEAQARLEALRAAMLVRIDAHSVWHSGESGSAPGA